MTTSSSHEVVKQLPQEKQNDSLMNINNKINYKNSKQNGYKCKICGLSYKYSQSLSSHKKKKHPNYNDDILDIKNKGISEFEELKKIFIEQGSIKDKKIENLINIINEKNKQIEDIMKTSKCKTINNITNKTINNNNGIINNITIVAFGKEDISLLNKDEIYKILCDKNYDPLIASIETIHFNERLPQYQNIKLKDIKSKYIDIHNGSSWEKKNKNNIIDDTLDNHIYNIKILKDSYPNKNKIKKSIPNLVSNYDKYYDLATEEKKNLNNKKITKEINNKKEDICLALHNKYNNNDRDISNDSV